MSIEMETKTDLNVGDAKFGILKKLRASRTEIDRDQAITPAYLWEKIESPAEQFQALLTANHARVINTSEADIGNHIRELIVTGNLRHTVASDRVRKQYPDLVEATNPLPPGSIEDWKEFLFNEVDAGLTSSYAAIATTGTIVLYPGADEPRSLSLVPPCHIVIVREETLYNDFTEAMNAQDWQSDMPTNMVLVSGPSKTADIQQTLAYGAHGPRDLIVLFIRKDVI